MKGKSALMAGVAAVALIATAQSGLAAKKTSDGTSAPTPVATATGPSNAELAARVQALEDALQASETKFDGDHSRLSTLEQSFNDTVWSFSNGRPTITSGDKRFSMAFRVRFQADMANFLQDSYATTSPVQYKDLSSGSVIRRAFFGVEGVAFKDFWYEIRYNGGGTNSESTGLSLARIAYTGIPNFRINVGIIEPAFTFEGTTSSGQLMFMERPEIDNIATTTFGGADARRGIELVYQKENAFYGGDNLVLMTAYTGSTIGSTSGHSNGATTTNGSDEQTQLLGRASYRFWSDGASNAVLGVSAASVLNAPGYSSSTVLPSLTLSDRPQIRVDGTSLISAKVNAKHASMYALDASVNFDNFFLGGEYANFTTDRVAAAGGDHPTFSGWYVEGSWILTGETKVYKPSALNNEVGGWAGPKVANPFSLEGGSWGAFELVTRYSDTDLDWHRDLSTGVAGGREKIVNVGVNWYLNNEVRLSVYGEHVDVDKLNAAGGTKQIGQTFNVIGARLQFTN